jgi:hypothetical protein
MKEVDNYNIYSTEKLNSLINEKGYINGDIVIRGNNIKSLVNLKKVYGNLGIDSNSLSDLGELNYVKNDFWISSAKNLKSLNNLERVGGNLSLRYSNIEDLGELWRVGNKLSLRDTRVESLSSLKEVKVLFLPKRFREVNIEFIKTQTVKYWSDKKNTPEVIKESLKDVGGENFRYNIFIPNDNEANYGWGKVWDSKLGFKVSLLKFRIPKNPLENFYVSKENLISQENNFIFYKNEIDKNIEYLNEFKDDYEIQKLRNRLIFDLLENFIANKIDCQIFIQKTEYYEILFSKFSSTTKLEFLPIYELLNKNRVISKLISTDTFSSNYSKIHELELRLKKRVLNGEMLVKRVNGLNDYIQNNINEYSKFIDEKLDKLYSSNFSFFNSLFGKLKTLAEINNEFPKKYRIEDSGHSSAYYMTRRDKSFIFLEKNKNNSIFIKYNNVLNEYNSSEIIQMKKKHWNGGQLWISYNENPLTYYGHNSDNFIYYIENLIHNIFYAFVLSFQNDFRISKGLPKIGEGWISETELFYKLKDYFKDEIVQNHGKPKWLGRQHVDIWFPKHKVGIEYQGLQHDKPIDFFGGEIAFLKNKERDKRKKSLFKKNNSILIEVRKGYDFESIVKEIKNYLKK